MKRPAGIWVNRIMMGGLACGLALLPTACSRGGLATDGPFGDGGPYSGTVIDCARPGGVAYSGFVAFHNTGGTAATERVALVHPRNLRLIVAWVVPIAGTDLIGVGSGYPSASELASTAPGAQWGQRQRVPGAVVRHTRGHDLIDLVLVVKPSRKVGSAKAINLYYQAGGTHYLLHYPYGLKISVSHTC